MLKKVKMKMILSSRKIQELEIEEWREELEKKKLENRLKKL